MIQRILIGLLMIGLVACSTTTKKNEHHPTTRKEMALHLVEHMTKAEYAAIKEKFNITMVKALSNEMIKNVWERLVVKEGKYKSHGFLNEKDNKVFIRVDFEKAFYVFRIVSDKGNKVSGFLLGHR